MRRYCKSKKPITKIPVKIPRLVFASEKVIIPPTVKKNKKKNGIIGGIAIVPIFKKEFGC